MTCSCMLFQEQRHKSKEGGDDVIAELNESIEDLERTIMQHLESLEKSTNAMSITVILNLGHELVNNFLVGSFQLSTT